MGFPKGTNIGGIQSVEDIRRRCKVDDDPEDDGCWHWLKAIGIRTGKPWTWYPALQQTTSIAIVVCHLKTGQRPKPGQIWYQRCFVDDCANPEHWLAGSASASAKRHPRKNPELHRLKITLAARSKSPLTQEKADEIRALKGHKTLVQCAAEYNVSRNVISRIWRGRTWRPLLPMGGNSVFNLAS